MQVGPLYCGLSSLLQFHGLRQRKILRRSADLERVTSGHQLPRVPRFVEYGKLFPINSELHLLALAGRNPNLLKGDETLWRFTRAGR